MNKFNKHFITFIEERIQNSHKKILNNKNYIENSKKFYTLYDEILEKSNFKEQNDLDNLCDYLQNMNYEETILAYKLGFIDGYNLNKFIKNN